MSEQKQKLNILIAYPYLKNDLIKEIFNYKNHVRFVLDSGAFTAWKAGQPINLDNYCRFIDSLPFQPWRYFALDVIGDPSATMKNYEIMVQRGFNPIPIFTRGEEISVLHDYYKTCDVVGIGGLVGTPGNKGFVKGIMKHVGSRKVHWLGFTAFDFIKYYKPYMCDSSSWESGARFGVMSVYVGAGKFLRVKKNEITNNKKPKEVTDALRRLGFEIDHALFSKNWCGGNSLARNVCAASIIKYTCEIEKNIGTKQFVALAGKQAFDLVYKNYERIMTI